MSSGSRHDGESDVPRGAVPDRYRDLLEGTTLGHLATVDPDGRPQVNQTGFATQPTPITYRARTVVQYLEQYRT